MIFETARLIVRHLAAEDVDALHAVYGDAEAMKWVGDGRPLTREQCVKWIDVTEHNYAARGYGMSALVLRASGEVIGFCGLVHPGGQETAELKYALRHEHWGQGLASEAAAAMIAYGAGAWRLTEIMATADPEHAASHRILLKVGMTRGEPRKHDDGSVTEVFSWRAQGDA
jgi:RimJ/RimL family protein N-acetyltransferase